MLTSRDTGLGTIKTFDPENMETAVGILLLCALELEICLGRGKKYPPSAAGKRRQKTAAGTRVNNNRQSVVRQYDRLRTVGYPSDILASCFR